MMNLKSMDSREVLYFVSMEPLIAFFMMRSTITESEEFPFVAGVSISRGNISLLMNPDKMLAMSSAEKMGVLVHEYLHVLMLHCTKRMRSDKSQHLKENIAKDMAINQLIVKPYNTGWALPDGAVFHDLPQFGFPPNLTSEQYFDLIDKKYTDDQLKSLYDPMDDHSGWGNDGGGGEDGDSEEIIKEVAKQYASSKYGTQLGKTLGGAGSAAGQMMETLLASERRDIDWRTEARQFLASVMDPKRQFTYKRQSRRYGFPFQGEKLKIKTKAMALIDTSGSMSAAYLSNIGGQLNLMSRIMQIDVVFVDADVQGTIKKYRPSAELTIPGRGGTDLQPGFVHAEENGYRGIIVFTDGDLFRKPECSIPTLWVIINNKKFTPPFGKALHVKWNY